MRKNSYPERTLKREKKRLKVSLEKNKKYKGNTFYGLLEAYVLEIDKVLKVIREL